MSCQINLEDDQLLVAMGHCHISMSICIMFRRLQKKVYRLDSYARQMLIAEVCMKWRKSIKEVL